MENGYFRQSKCDEHGIRRRAFFFFFLLPFSIFFFFSCGRKACVNYLDYNEYDIHLLSCSSLVTAVQVLLFEVSTTIATSAGWSSPLWVCLAAAAAPLLSASFFPPKSQNFNLSISSTSPPIPPFHIDIS